MRFLGGSKKGGCSWTKALLSGYMDGRLGAGDRAGVEQHLAACARCRSDLDSLRATVALLRGLPQAVPSRRFAVAPARPLPGRRLLPVLRHATAAVVVLLVAVVGVDQAGVFEDKSGASGFAAGGLAQCGGDGACWAVNGVRSGIGSDEQTPAVLLVPDGTDSASAAVEALAANGLVFGSVEFPAADLTRVVLTEDGEDAVAMGEAEEFAVVGVPSGSNMSLNVNSDGLPPALGPVLETRDGSHLNMVSSDYSQVYSFDMSDAERLTAPAAGDDGWLRPAQYGLAAVALLLGMAAGGVWLWRRQRLAEARVDPGPR